MLKSVLVQSCAYMWIILAVIVERRHPTYAIHFNIKGIHFCDRFRTFLVFQAPSCSLFLSLDLSSLWSGSLQVLLFLRIKNSVPIIRHITRAGYNQLDLEVHTRRPQFLPLPLYVLQLFCRLGVNVQSRLALSSLVTWKDVSTNQNRANVAR